MYDRKKGPAAAEPLERETLGEQGLAKKDSGEQKEQNNSGEQKEQNVPGEQGLAKKISVEQGLAKKISGEQKEQNNSGERIPLAGAPW